MAWSSSGARACQVVIVLLCTSVLPWAARVAASEVVFATLVHRHGDRSPVSFLPTDAANNGHWLEGPGQLTPIGMQQLHALGVSLRERYVTSDDLFPGMYSHRHVYVRSTDLDRTLMSAQSLLQGLFPPGTGPDDHTGAPALTADDLQPVPVHTVPRADDALLRGYADADCPMFSHLRSAQRQTQEWLDVEATHAEFIEQSRTLSGLPSLSLASMFSFHDPLVCDHAHNLTWPAGVTQEVFDTAEELADFTLVRMFYTTEQQRLGAGVFVREVGERLQAAAAQQPQPGWVPIEEPATPEVPGDKLGPRMVLYSAHDTTLAAVLSALGLFDGKNPPYASSVVFELHLLSGSGTEGSYGVRMYYNQGVGNLWSSGNIITLPGCTDLCPLDQFMSLTRRVAPSPEQYEEECEIPEEEKDPQLFERGQEFVGAFVGVIFVTLVAIICCAVWHRKRRAASTKEQLSRVPLHGSDEQGQVSGAASGLELTTAARLPTGTFAIATHSDDEADDAPMVAGQV